MKPNTTLWIVVCLLLSTLLFAESGGTETTLDPEKDLMRSYQREYAFLVSQRDSLDRQKQVLETEAKTRYQNSLKDLKEAEKKLISLQTENEVKFENLQTLEKTKKSELARASTLQSTWKKVMKSVSKLQDELNYKLEATEVDLQSPENLAVSDVVTLGKKALSLIELGSSRSTLKGSYVNLEGDLVEGSIIRLGRVAAWTQSNGKESVLGPGKNGVLQEVEVEKTGRVAEILSGAKITASLSPVYLFESLNEKLTIKKSALFIDRVADFLPVLLLAALFLVVASLFASLARI